MPQSAVDLERDPYWRILLMGIAKCGKTTSAVVSLVNTFGPGYVIACGDKNSLLPAARRTKKFVFDVVRDEPDMEACLKEGRTGVKEGRYKWVVVDDFSLYASFLEGAMRDASAAANKSGKPDGRTWSPEFKQRLINVAHRMFDWKAHIIFISHYTEQSGEIVDPVTGNKQRAKSGRGILPMIYGAAREELPAIFHDVIFMEREEGRRVFQINPEGVWGPGSRSADGTHTIDADFGAFMKLATETSDAAAAPKRGKR